MKMRRLRQLRANGQLKMTRWVWSGLSWARGLGSETLTLEGLMELKSGYKMRCVVLLLLSWSGNRGPMEPRMPGFSLALRSSASGWVGPGDWKRP